MSSCSSRRFEWAFLKRHQIDYERWSLRAWSHGFKEPPDVMARWHATGHRHVPMLRACLYASSTAAFSRRVLLSSGRPAMLAWNRASWLSHHKPSRASSRWFCSSSSFASFSANTGRQGSSTQRNAAQAALELSQRDWLTALTPPQCQPQEQEEDEEVVAALSGLAVSDAQRGEDAVVAGPNVLVIGIDPDVSGAMAVLHGNDVTTAEVFDVPSLRVMVGSRHRRRHDTRSIVSMIKNLNAPTGSVAYIEQSIPLPKDGRQGWWGSGFGYGIWIGTLVASGISVVPVPSSVWKRAMGLFGKSVTKDDCRACASSMFPSLASKLKRKKDHGRAEALLIAAHGKGIFAPLKASPTESGLDDVQSSENDYQNGCLLSA